MWATGELMNLDPFCLISGWDAKLYKEISVKSKHVSHSDSIQTGVLIANFIEK